MDLMDLVVLVKAETSNFKQGMNDITTSSQDMLGKLKSVGAQIVSALALKEVAEAVGQFSADCVNAYADLQQNVGGIQKLYGTAGKTTLEDYNNSVAESARISKEKFDDLNTAQTNVLKNAKTAYKETGMSMNTYMETATQFASALINSTDSATEASQQTDVAMKAISDNWNTFGGDLESITNAYKGFSKQNYTMLDNLKLGYGGTKEEMERLIADANEYGEAMGKSSDLTIDSFSDIVTAIEYIQEKQNIAGTTAKEATTTISGSVNMMKASWENFKTAFGDPDADIGESFRQLTETIVGGVDENGKAFSGLVQNVIPSIEAILSNFGTMGSTIIEMFGQYAPLLLEKGIEWVQNIGEGLVQGIPNLVSSALNLVLQFSEFVRANAGTVISTGMDLLINFVKGIMNSLPTLIETVPTIISNFAGVINDNFPTVLAKGFELLVEVGKGIINAIPTFIANIPKIFLAFVDLWTAMNWLNLGSNVIKMITSGIQSLITAIPNALKNIGQTAWNAFKGINWASVGSAVINAIKGGISGVGSLIWNALKSIGSSAMGVFKGMNWSSLGNYLVSGIWSGITGMANWLISKISGFASKVLGSIKGFFGINSPSKETAWMGKMLMEGMAVGIDDNAKTVINSAKDMASDLLDTFETVNGVDLNGTYSMNGLDSEELANTTSLGSTTIGDVQIVVNAKEGQSAKEIADEVMYRMQHLKDRNDAVFA